jgi:predicted RNA-binding Zn-ribbon protein involved in translation (DUF1610 family)
MFVPIGTHKLQRDLGARFRDCPICERETVHAQAWHWRWFTVFFIPVIPLGGRQHVLRCNVCGKQVNVTPDQVVPGLASSAGPGVLPAEITKPCPRCAENVKAAARVCRYCGSEFDADSIEQAQRRAAHVSASWETQRRAESARKRARWYGWALIPLVLVTLFMGSAVIAGIVQEQKPENSGIGSIAVGIVLFLGVPLGLTVLAWRRWRRNRKEAKELRLRLQAGGTPAGP